MNTPAQEPRKKLEKQSPLEKIETLRELALELSELLDRVIENSPFERTETPQAVNKTAKLIFAWAGLDWEILNKKRSFQAGNAYNTSQLLLVNRANKTRIQVDLAKPSYHNVDLDVHVNRTSLFEFHLRENNQQNPAPETAHNLNDAISALTKITNMLKAYIAVNDESAEEKKLKRLSANCDQVRQESLELLRSL
ncbi:MAG TPA: hypothetical protein P5229_02230 [Candidatus Gracilibacteria bacterium]|nr:hypothetical protein [Candidatus Gracilibacteria bacterium]HRY91138.1 hypothetical protein [Candidatus Gracilibacteria bacterium]